MIRPINIKLNAAHPELPLVEATTFVGAPSSVFVRGVPKACGSWSITAVSVAVTYPDNSTTTRAAVESADGVWVATIPGTATSGRTASGFKILADGVDENGAAVTGYVLGFADFSVLSFTPVPAPGGTFWILRYFDAIPAVPRKGDVAVVDGVLKYYNGSTWTPFADLTNYYTKSETDEAIERVAAYYITYNAAGAAFPTRDALLNAMAYYSGGELRVPTRNDYAVVLADESHGGAEWRYIFAIPEGTTTGQWEAQYPIESVITFDDSVTRTSPNAVRSSGIWAALWGALAASPAGFSSMYDWVVAQLGQKRNYTDLSYNTQATIDAPALHAILTSRGSQVLEYYLPCTEDIPATPAINHVYTWRKDGAEFYITQGVSVYSTVWILYGSGGEQLATTTTDNANDGWFPDLTFVVSANSEVTTTKVNSYPAETHDTLALNSEIPTSLPWSAITGKPQSFAPSAHASTHAAGGSDPITPSSIGAVPTSRTVNGKALTDDVTLTANDIDYSVPGGSQSVQLALQGIEAMLAGKQSALSSQQLANIAAVSDALAFDAAHSYAAGDPVVYNGTLYTFSAAHTGAWTGSDVAAVDIIARLALKANDNAVVKLTGNQTIAGAKSFSDWRAYSQVATPDFHITFGMSNLQATPFALIFQNGDANAQYKYALPLLSGTLALLESPAFTGTPTAPTAAAGTNTQQVATTAFVQGAIPYTLGTPIVIDTASPEVVEGETVNYGAATLANRTANIVQVTSATALDELRITFPAATSGKVRDFGLRVEIGTGSAALAAPALVPIAPTGETIKIENADGAIPALADGTATAKGVTLLYFSENAPGVFVVNGEQVEEVA